MMNCIIVGLGGFLGAVARYLIGLIPINPQNGFPVKTLLINIAGAFVIGLVVALGAKKDWKNQRQKKQQNEHNNYGIKNDKKSEKTEMTLFFRIFLFPGDVSESSEFAYEERLEGTGGYV